MMAAIAWNLYLLDWWLRWAMPSLWPRSGGPSLVFHKAILSSYKLSSYKLLVTGF